MAITFINLKRKNSQILSLVKGILTAPFLRRP
jgi:hypothetical protein